MRIKSLVIGYVFALALFLFAQRHPNSTQPGTFRAVVDLTSPDDGKAAVDGATSKSNGTSLREYNGKNWERRSIETRLDAPAAYSKSLWTVDQIPPERLIAPLVVLDVRNSVRTNPDYQLSVSDIAKWERSHGEIPQGSVVMTLTGSPRTNPSLAQHAPGYSEDAAKFLIEGRSAVGLGTDSRRVDSGLSKDQPVYKYSLSRSTYVLENVAELERAPAGGGIVMVAPAKIGNSADAPVRILALAR